VTSRAKGYPFEVMLPDSLPAAGVILSDHLKSADWQERDAEYIGAVPPLVLAEVRAKLKPLLGT
jgi:mRNA interferase MazF